MASAARGVVLVNFEPLKPWDNAELPLHLPILSDIHMDTEQVPLVVQALNDSLSKEESFTPTLHSAVERVVEGRKQIVQQLSHVTFMALHLEALRAVRAVVPSFPVDLTVHGDMFDPAAILRSADDQFAKAPRINNVTFAMSLVKPGPETWLPPRVIELRGDR